jgi:hypothetical protein
VPGVDSAYKNKYQDITGVKAGRPVRMVDNLEVPMLRNLEALTSQNPLGAIGL